MPALASERVGEQPLTFGHPPGWQARRGTEPTFSPQIEQLQAIDSHSLAAMTTQERLFLLLLLSPLSLSPIFASARYCNVQNYVCVSNR